MQGVGVEKWNCTVPDETVVLKNMIKEALTRRWVKSFQFRNLFQGYISCNQHETQSSYPVTQFLNSLKERPLVKKISTISGLLTAFFVNWFDSNHEPGISGNFPSISKTMSTLLAGIAITILSGCVYLSRLSTQRGWWQMSICPRDFQGRSCQILRYFDRIFVI